MVRILSILLLFSISLNVVLPLVEHLIVSNKVEWVEIALDDAEGKSSPEKEQENKKSPEKIDLFYPLRGGCDRFLRATCIETYFNEVHGLNSEYHALTPDQPPKF